MFPKHTNVGLHLHTDKLILEEPGNESSAIISWTVHEHFLKGTHQYLVVSVREGTNDVSYRSYRSFSQFVYLHIGNEGLDM